MTGKLLFSIKEFNCLIPSLFQQVPPTMKTGFFDFNNFSLIFKTTSSDTEGSIIFIFDDGLASLNKERISSGSDITTGPGLPLFAILNALDKISGILSTS